MTRKKDKTTVIFVNKNQNSSKPIQIPSSYIKHWRKIVFGIVGCFVLLLAATIYLSLNRPAVLVTKEKIVKQLVDGSEKPASLDTVAIKRQYQAIDKKLATINKFLKARGLKPMPKNVGGESEKEILSTEETGNLYQDYLKKMIKMVSYTPMGYPHFGAITSGFGHRENPFTGESIEAHKGLDIKGNYGELVKSTANGSVTFASNRGGYGNCIIINHGNGFETYYGHLSKILVKNGQKISAGQIIGQIGSTGRSTGPHLHYEIHRNGKNINPRSFLTLE